MPTQPRPSMTPEDLLGDRRPKRVGRRLVVLAEAGSTNSVALESAGEPDADGLVVLADYQTTGRGRMGRAWLSPRGASVLCSVLLLMPREPEAAGDDAPGDRAMGGRAGAGGWLTLAAAVAACEAVREATEVTPAIKWPNDLCVAGRKLGGILAESRPVGRDTRAWVVGIGLNCTQQPGHFPPELRDTATSLELAASHPIDRLAVTRHLLRSLDRWLGERPPPGDDRVHHAWLSYAEAIGQRVRLRCQGRDYVGRTLAVDPSGGLIVETDDGRRQWFDPMLTSLL